MSDHGWRHLILQNIGMRVEVFAELHPRPYLLLTTVFALLGYAFLLLFPLLTLAGIAGMYRALAAGPDVAWLSMLGWLLVTGSCGWATCLLFRVRHPAPAGVVLDRLQAPALFKRVDDTGAHYGCPRIDRIVITGGYQLEIVNTPVHALPFWSSRSLVIGLPLLQCLSMTRFHCSLARRLGQASRRTNRLLNWLNSLRSIWPRYREHACTAGAACPPVRTMFSLYAPLYTVLSTGAARLDELQADSYAMELFSDEDVLDAVTTDAVYRYFLRERYWPAIRKLQDQDAIAVGNAHARIPTVLKAGLQAGNIARYIEATLSAEQQWDDPWPSLVRRIENIGHSQAFMAPDTFEPVAVDYLDTSYVKLEAATEALPPQPLPRAQSWAQARDALHRLVQFVLQDVPLRLKSLLRDEKMPVR